MMDIKRALLQLQVFDQKTSATRGNKFSGSGIEKEIMSEQQLAEELHRPIITKFKKREVKSLIIDNTWSADLGDMQLISKLNKKLILYYVLLIISVNTHGLLLWKIKHII